jgi:hypothetical protein
MTTALTTRADALRGFRSALEAKRCHPCHRISRLASLGSASRPAIRRALVDLFLPWVCARTRHKETLATAKPTRGSQVDANQRCTLPMRTSMGGPNAGWTRSTVPRCAAWRSV